MMPRTAQQSVVSWNQRYPVGTVVQVTKDMGDTIVTKTRSPAQMLSQHTAVVFLEDISGCYLLDRCRPVGGQHDA